MEILLILFGAAQARRFAWQEGAGMNCPRNDKTAQTKKPLGARLFSF
jgi:hypothetical protein